MEQLGKIPLARYLDKITQKTNRPIFGRLAVEVPANLRSVDAAVAGYVPGTSAPRILFSREQPRAEYELPVIIPKSLDDLAIPI